MRARTFSGAAFTCQKRKSNNEFLPDGTALCRLALAALFILFQEGHAENGGERSDDNNDML